MLEDALMELGEGNGDEHITELAERVRSLMKDGNEKGSEVKMQAVENEVERVRSGVRGQADEETEKVSQL